MKEKSIWIDTINIEEFPKLNENINTDILVIGGGIAGILCAYELKRRNFNVVLVEKNRIGEGITKNTTAFITAQHEILYQDIIKNFGLKEAKEYLDINLKAVERYKELAKLYNIDLKVCSSTLFSSLSDEKIELEKRALNLLNYNYESIDLLPVNIPIKGGVSFPNQAIIHPLKLIKELSKELTIYEKTEVTILKGKYAYCGKNKISFNKVIIATHFPFINRSGLYFVKMFQRRSYVVAIKYPKIEGTYCSIDEKGLYFRSYKDYLIIGGNDRDTKDFNYENFKEYVKQIFKSPEIVYEWSNQDCVTIDNLPYIGKYDNIHNSWYVVTGFNLWGFSLAMAGSFIIADLIEHKKEFKLFNPGRVFIKKQLFINLKNSIKHLITLKTPRCSHLGCALKWNKIDKVYECPCHGSRFDINGKVINGPAKKSINTSKKS